MFCVEKPSPKHSIIPRCDMFSYYLTTNINNICRICLEKGPKLMPIFDPIKPPHFSVLIMACASVQVTEGDGLPPYICQKCISKLNIAYQFKIQCETSDTKLRQYFQNFHQLPEMSGFIEFKKVNPGFSDAGSSQLCSDSIEEANFSQRSNGIPDMHMPNLHSLQNVGLEVSPALQETNKNNLNDLKIELGELKPTELELKNEEFYTSTEFSSVQFCDPSIELEILSVDY